MSGKGSSPRPFSVTQEEFGSNFENIFGKKTKLDKKDNGEDFNKCGCERSPTGKCVGWHNLSDDEYQKRLEEYNQQQGKTAK